MVHVVVAALALAVVGAEVFVLAAAVIASVVVLTLTSIFAPSGGSAAPVASSDAAIDVQILVVGLVILGFLQAS